MIYLNWDLYKLSVVTAERNGANCEQSQPGLGSDSEQFAARKIPRITIHTLTQKTWEARIIHTSKDKLSAIQADDYYQTYGLVAAYLTFLDDIPNRSAMSPKP
jgi:hypothetical protein